MEKKVNVDLNEWMFIPLYYVAQPDATRLNTSVGHFRSHVFTRSARAFNRRSTIFKLF